MAVPKWFIIARNEYRIRTSIIRKVRPYFPYLIIGFLVVFVAFFAPAIVNPFFGIFDIPAFIVSVAAIALMQIILVMFFFYFILIPITNTLKDVQTTEYEIFLSSPVKPSDVLLGKFLGVMPFYAIGIVIITGIFTAFLTPLGLDLIQIAIIILTFVITFLLALWIGIVISAILRTRLGRTARGKDIGKALAIIIALPLIALMYAIMGGGLVEALTVPGTSGFVKTILSIFPSSWGAELFILFAIYPGNIGALWFETLTRFGGLVLFFIVALWLGTKAANRAYSLETATFTAATAKQDGIFYRGIKTLGGSKSFGTLLVSIFKDYGRRFENISKIVYLVGLLILISVFFSYRDDPLEAVMLGIFIYPFFTAFVVGEVTIRGKENLFIYRKAPLGERRYIRARLIQGLIVLVPIAAAYAIISLVLVPSINIPTLLVYTGGIVLIIMAYTVFALGLFLLMPVFTDKPAELVANAMILQVTSIIFFMISSLVAPSIETGLIIFLLLTWSTGLTIFYLGIKRLSRIE